MQYLKLDTLLLGSLLDHPAIKIVRTYNKRVDFNSAIILAEQEGKRLLSNKEADMILSNDGLFHDYSKLGLFPCFTGTLLIYSAPNKPFGKSIEYDDLTFEIAEEYQKVKNMALIVQHPNYAIKKNAIKIKNQENLTLIPFQNKDGWYLTDDFGVPNGKHSKEENKDARYLWRNNTPTICPLVRFDGALFGGRSVGACGRLGNRFGVGVV